VIGNEITGKTLLLMGSKAFGKRKLPLVISKKIDQAMTRKMTVIVGEAPGANRAFQDYLASCNYQKVIVGHAKSIRYNAGNWKTKKFGDKVRERENKMILTCDSAIIIWTDKSGVIAENLELLKRLGKSTFLYEYSNETQTGKASWLDPNRVYDPYFFWKEYMRRKKQMNKKSTKDKLPKSEPD
jgi:hypothetical protein